MKLRATAAVFACASAFSAAAATPEVLMRGYETEARKAAPAFAGFSAARGERLFTSTHGTDWSCASCHGTPPTGAGKHARTGKEIAPLAPTANAARFTDPAKVEKWFRRNCNDVLARECTPLEKGDVLAYLMRLGR
jgi:hypothetical protein